jgi:hypothetical protein
VYEWNFCQKFLGQLQPGGYSSYYSQTQTDSSQDVGEGGREGGREGDPIGTPPITSYGQQREGHHGEGLPSFPFQDGGSGGG